MEIPLDEAVHFDVETIDPETGDSADADSTPTFSVFEEANDTPIVTGNLTKRTSLTGEYRGTFTASTGNGFEVGKWYTVKAYATVNEFVGKQTTLRFRALPAEPAPGYPDLSGTTVGLTSAAIAAIWGALTAGITTVGSIGKLIKDVLSLMTGGSSGARTVTITVNDGATVLENAIVRLSQGAESYIGDTDASGVVTFNVDDATWTVAITKVGYSFAGTTLVVDGNETVTYSMSSISFSPPADPSFCTLAIRVWDTEGAVAVGVDVNAQVILAPEGDGDMFNDSVMTETTGADGYAEFTVPKGCSVRYWIGEREKTIDAIEEDTVEFVKNWLGHE